MFKISTLFKGKVFKKTLAYDRQEYNLFARKLDTAEWRV
jgi:hypothetical protein